MESPVFDKNQNPFSAIPLSFSDFNPHNQPHRNSHAVLWRPWVNTGEDAQSGCIRNSSACPNSTTVAPQTVMVGGKCQLFQHPVRLFWPKSKSFDYLYSDGEALLRNFPVQATITFYDESDSEEEEEEEDEWEEEDTEDSGDCLKSQSHFTSYN